MATLRRRRPGAGIRRVNWWLNPPTENAPNVRTERHVIGATCRAISARREWRRERTFDATPTDKSIGDQCGAHSGGRVASVSVGVESVDVMDRVLDEFVVAHGGAACDDLVGLVTEDGSDAFECSRSGGVDAGKLKVAAPVLRGQRRVRMLSRSGASLRKKLTRPCASLPVSSL